MAAYCAIIALKKIIKNIIRIKIINNKGTNNAKIALPVLSLWTRFNMIISAISVKIPMPKFNKEPKKGIIERNKETKLIT